MRRNLVRIQWGEKCHWAKIWAEEENMKRIMFIKIVLYLWCTWAKRASNCLFVWGICRLTSTKLYSYQLLSTRCGQNSVMSAAVFYQDKNEQ